jgi:1-acyl-sn-glycerol-3-phosphate acyltransferase
MPKNSYKASLTFNRLLRPLVALYLKHIFYPEYDTEKIEGLKPPFMVYANHTNFWDPFLVGICFKEPVYFVTSDTHFRTPLLRNLLKLVGAIPKSKFVSDANTIRGILQVIKNNGIVCIFPEGRRNWDGTTLPLLKAPAHLAKKLDVPVVTILFRGASLAMPRWASKSRKGKLSLDCKVALRPEDLRSMPEEEVYKALCEALDHNEYEMQREKMEPYITDRLAEKLELFLFCCPHCKSLDSMESSMDRFYCKSCGYSVTYDKYGFLSATAGRLTDAQYFDIPGDWNTWQLSYIEGLLKDKGQDFISHPLLIEYDIDCRTGSRAQPMQYHVKGTMKFFTDRIELTGPDGIMETFLADDINGANIQGNKVLEFYHKNVLYRFSRKKTSLCAYKWVKVLEFTTGKKTD